LDKPPPGPCRLCGSEKHWNRECPNYTLYSEGVKRSANLSSRSQPLEDDIMYDNAYSVLLNQAINASHIDFSAGFDTAALANRIPEYKTASQSEAGPSPQPASLEEVVDEDELIFAATPKAQSGTLEEIEMQDSTEAESLAYDEAREALSTSRGRPEEATREGEAVPPQQGQTSETSEALPKHLIPVRIPKRRAAAPGLSALGVSVLSMRGSVGSRDGEIIDLRLDTCADVTLISQDFYRSLDKPPPIREGIPMKLIQLTQEEEGIQGYTNIPVFMMSEEGELIETEAEAYFVPGMSVPILLGEDYQVNYELALTRNVESGSRVHFRDWEFTVKAQNGLSREAKTKLHRAKGKFGEEKLTICASRDYRIRPHECRSIFVEGYFEDDQEWLVEKSLLANANDSFFALPNVLISSTNPWVPICNPTDQPRIVRKGESVGTLVDPQAYFDKPKSEEQHLKFAQSAETIAQVIQTNLE
ncbi:hypothetical protein C8R44DRAFT_557283, partial [Mycena epipterygia]